MYDKVIKNKYGFYELKEKPHQTEIEKYYKKKYYQSSKGSYQKEYTKEEVIYIKNRLNRKYHIICDYLNTSQSIKYLDIGCGEGWGLKFFKEKGWDVIGLDYSSFGCKSINPDCLENLIEGNIYKNLDQLIISKKNYNIILLDNVLEHVLDPFELVKKYFTYYLKTDY